MNTSMKPSRKTCINKARIKKAHIKKLTRGKIWLVALLGLFVAVGCGREQGGNRNRPVVTSTNPANAATSVAVNTSVSATFSAIMAPSTINGSTFTVTGPGGVAVPGVVSSSNNTATFTPTGLLAASTVYTATITTGASDLNGLTLANNFVWSFTTGTIPRVIATFPAAGAVLVPLNQRLTATFSEAMSAASITTPGTFTLKVAGVGGAAVAGTVSYIAGTNTAMFTPSANLAANTQYTATVSTAAQSASGSPLAAASSWNFTTGATANAIAPTVVSTVPAAGATGVAVNSKVSAVFSTVMDSASITAPGTFSLAVTAGTAVPGTVTYAGNTATFSPTSNLAANTQYTSTITTAAKDLTGNGLAASKVFSFTTGALPDITPPTITLTSPPDADVNVVLNKAISATFSEPMDPVTITAPGTFKLNVFGVGGAAVAGTVTYDVPSQIATFTPAANLAGSTRYTATVSNAAKDLAGNALVAGAKPNPWSFTTGASVATLQPANLRTASTFASFGGNAGITNQGVNTVINGDIGTTAADTLITGFHDTAGCVYTQTPLNIGTVNGTIYTAPGTPLACGQEANATTASIATQAAADALTAYNSLTPASLPGGADPNAGQLGGLTLPPGVYAAAGGVFLLTGSDLTLDAQGDSSAVWVFQTAAALTVGAAGAPRSIVLINGAQAKNVFWQVGSAATINAAGGGTMVGTIIAAAGVTVSTAGNAAITTLNGRALGLNASVTVVNTVINLP